jgi:hypothetical protein
VYVCVVFALTMTRKYASVIVIDIARLVNSP